MIVLTGSCVADEFQCADGSCIEASFECDGYEDCDDASDELSCSGEE